MKHLIIGAGAAGISAARTILQEKANDTVIVVSEDREIYSRCMLHRVISGERSAESINFINDGLLSCPRFNWIKGKTVTRLDAGERAVYAGDERIASGDTVIIASGAASITPPIGAFKTAKNAFGLRHLSDARAIAQAAGTARRIAVIGAGLVGLDAVDGLIELGERRGKGFDITVVEMAETALAVNMDPRAASAYQKRFEERGVQFHLGRKVVNTGGGDSLIGSLELDTGTTVPCDMVIMAVGVRPAIGFLAGSGIETGRAVTVDAKLQTNVPGIYAAGDAAGLSGIWPNARKQGETAAKNICGWICPTRIALPPRIPSIFSTSLPCRWAPLPPRRETRC
ncbi:MAG: FAD-dependent oxidoreductase [Treponema sp.]|jgi:NAD(P)H-nitrite reductase large subunit|nr:FAD-dependent oxidoreductase [Treponema sp.]